MPTSDVPVERTSAGRDQSARTFVEQYFQHLSGPEVLAQFQQDYAAYVDYYDKVLDRNAVLREKARFVKRWPVRSYRPRADRLHVACGMLDKHMVCTVTGLVDFQCGSPDRHATSAGVARFRASLSFIGGRPQIISEESTLGE